MSNLNFAAATIVVLAIGALITLAVQDFLATGIHNVPCLLPCR